MPSPRKTEAQRRVETLEKLYQYGKVNTGFTGKQIADMMGMSPQAVYSHRKNLAAFDWLFTLGKILGWTDQDWLQFIHAGEK